MYDLKQKYRHYASRMRAYMDARNITGEIGGELIGAHPTTVYDLRRGATDLDDEWRAKVAAGFGVDHDILFGTNPLPPPTPKEIHPAKKRGRKPRPSNDNLGLYGLAAGSMQGQHSMTNEPIEQVACPPALRHVLGAYALRTRGDSMWPRFKNGETLFINPNQSIRAGDDVVIQVQNHENSGTETWVKCFDAEDKDTIFVSQYNPAARMQFRKKYVKHIHRVVPVGELFEDK